MKLLIASDIHGDVEGAKYIFDVFKNEGFDKILLLGDLLYFGPRNTLTANYNPKEVIKLLNDHKEYILSVRGNCDAEVDQMVLDFPILADYCYLSFDGLGIYATHGHHYNSETPPPLNKGEILLHGHTHIIKCEEFGNENYCLNPGSTTYPKGGNPKSYMMYEARRFTVKDFDGNILLSKQF